MLNAKRHIKKLFLATITVVVLSAFFAPDLYANTADITSELSKKEDAHKKLALKTKSLNTEIQSLRKDLVSVSKDLQMREANLIETEKNLKDLREKKQEYIEKIYKENQSMGGMVSAARKYSRNPTLAILANESPLQVARSMSIIKTIIPTINEKSNYLKEQLAELNEVETKISNELASHKSQKDKLDSEVKQLTSLVEKRKELYYETTKETKEYEAEIARLRKESKNIEELMLNLKTKVQRKPQIVADIDISPSADGKFMPVSGIIYTKFGDTDDMGAESKGITFTTLSGARVITPMSGTVKFAGPFQGHRSLLIIEHPNGYHSLISGLDRIDTMVGATLIAGEPVGVTSTELQAPKIYYELRKGGKPINPQTVLVANLKQGKG